jgi:hypothetical protein
VPKPPFDGPKLKIERAKRHLADFRAVFRSLDNTDFVRYNLEPQAQGSGTDVVLAKEFDFPGDLTLVVGDALYNLRSALDQAASRCAVLAGKSPNRTYFPHGKDKAGFEDSLREKCRQVPVEVRKAIVAQEPYYGGKGFLLRALHDLNLVDKHTELLNYNVNLGALSIGPGHHGFASGHVRRSPKMKLIWPSISSRTVTMRLRSPAH